MSNKQEEKPKSFTDIVPPGATEKGTEEMKNSIVTGQGKLFDGLTSEQADITLNNMKLLCPLDEYEIAGEKYKRHMLSPKDLRYLKKVEREYAEAVKQEFTDPDARLDLDFNLIYEKAKLFLGMTKEQFENTDFEYLQIVLDACELRTQGFRRLQ